MAAKEYKHSSGDNSVVDGSGNSNNSSQDYDDKASSDVEVALSQSEGSMRRDEPFGDETNSELKYRIMAWWSAPSPKFILLTQLIEIFTGKQG